MDISNVQFRCKCHVCTICTRIHYEDTPYNTLVWKTIRFFPIHSLTSRAFWKRQLQLPWREAGPPTRHDDKVDLDQEVVNNEVSLSPEGTYYTLEASTSQASTLFFSLITSCSSTPSTPQNPYHEYAYGTCYTLEARDYVLETQFFPFISTGGGRRSSLAPYWSESTVSS